MPDANLPRQLYDEAREFLIKYLDSDVRSREQSVRDAFFGEPILATITWGINQATFVRELVDIALKVGTLGSGENALCAVVRASADRLGIDRQEAAASLCERIKAALAAPAAVSVPTIQENIMPASIPESAASDTKPTVFICYSHKNKDVVERINVNLKPLMRGGVIQTFQDTQIPSGARWRVAIDGAIARAVAAIVVVSSDFIASDFIHAQEWPKIKAAADARGLVVFYVVADDCATEYVDGLGDLQAVHDTGVTLANMGDADKQKVYLKLVRDVAARFPAVAPPNPM